ncbi:hypothetical protein [Streptomyces thermoalcalitolerans]|uniref:Uncharacterized protein n=1 Tax=Streptomyces thermoalcalitolerans TaxID=65605 RepID=A0ABN1NPR5_9ACTN
MTYHRVRRDKVEFDVRWLCRDRFVPAVSVQCPESIEVYRVVSKNEWGEVLSCSQAELEQWDAAVRTCLGSLSRALEDLYRAHGGQECKVNLYTGRRSRTEIPQPFPWPGRRKRMRKRSEQAQRAFAAAVQRAEEEYRPVREEIARRLAEHKAEEEARERARREEEARRLSVLNAVAAKRVWLFTVAEAGSPVFVHRTDVPAALALPDSPAESSPEDGLTAGQLEERLLALVRGSDRTVEIQWDTAAQAEVERECRAQDVPVSFWKWWDTVTKDLWKDSRQGPQPFSFSSSRSSRSSFVSGVSGAGRYIGGYDGGGYDGGGFSGFSGIGSF